MMFLQNTFRKFFSANRGSQNSIPASKGGREMMSEPIILDGFLWIDKVHSRNLRKEISDAIRKDEGDILNKHLYIGLHGSAAWERIEMDPNFAVKKLAYSLLCDKKPNNFKSILEAIREDSGEIGVDIVSLGSGTGNDDLLIMDEVWRTYKSKMALFAIDLSADLLRRAVTNIKDNLYKNPTQNKNTSLHAICVDIDNLITMNNYFQQHGCQSKRLFHLLGLTLGNNKEYEFLRNISKGMGEGDYLLLGVDFCMNSGEWFEESVGSYENTEHAIMNFLSGPLHMSLQIDKDVSPNGRLRFFGQMPKMHAIGEDKDYYDYVTNGINVITKKVVNAKGQALSDIDGAYSLARYYVDVSISKEEFRLDMAKKGGPGKLFDYSNKYDSKNFIKFLYSNAGALKLRLVEPNVMRWGKGSQHLVLLKKESKGAGIMATTAIPRLTNFLRYNLEKIEKDYNGTNLEKFKNLAKGMIPYFEGNDTNYRRIEKKIKNEPLNIEKLCCSSKEKDTKKILNEIKKLI